MMRSMLASCAAMLLFGVAGEAHADWPIFAHDSQRTALSTGLAQIVKPVPRWRSYLGGGVSHTGGVGIDLDGNGTSDLLVVSGGRVLARRTDDYQFWNSPLIDARSIVDVLDFDGDGQDDILVAAGDRLVLLAAKTGAIEWQSLNGQAPGHALGNVGAVRIADLDGDGFADVLVTAEWCGSLANADARTAVAFSFRGGGSLVAPKVLFDQKGAVRDYNCGGHDSLADIDGDGVLDWVAEGDRHLYAYAVRDDPAKSVHAGDLKFTSDDLGFLPWGSAGISVGDVDGDGKADLALFTNGAFAPGNNSRRVQVVGLKTDPISHAVTLSQKWAVSVADLTNDTHAFSANSLVDLDGDGQLDVVTSFFVAGKWRLDVYNAATGAIETSAPNNVLAQVVDLDGLHHFGVLANDTSGTHHLYVWQGGGLVDTVALPANVAFPSALDRKLARVQDLADRVITINACGDARPELVAFEYDNNSKAVIASAYQTSTAATPVRCTHVFDVTSKAETYLDVFPLPDGSLAGARSSGFMSRLIAQDGLVDALAGGEFASPGVRLGGYYSGPYGHNGFPVAVKLGATTPVYATDSRGYLLSLDASAASLLTPAKTSWSLSNATEPTGFDITGDATAEIFAWHANALNVLDANTGIALKSFSVLTANNQAPLGDIMATDLNADGHPDLLYQIFNGGSGNVETYAVDYTSGASLWAAPYLGVEAGCWEPGLSFAPNATGAPDLVTSNCSEAVQLAAGTGAMKAHTNTLWGSFLISFDANSDGTPELYSTGTRAYTGAFDHALTPSWTLTSTMPAGQHYAAVAHCSDGTARYAGTREDQPIFFVLDAATGAQLNGSAAQPGVILAGGASFASLDAAVASGKFPGVLGNVTAVANLHGANTPAFLLGSTDGFLYAFDACAGTMLWALNLRWAVGQPILADVRNNGQEQIVVSVGDGYLYGIDQEVFPAPVSVRDVDPLSGKPNTEVPDIDTLDTLYVAWDLVPGATSYECAVIDPSGTIITAHGDFIDCGNGSSASIAGLVLHDGAVYQQAVRALGAPGASIESFSPGVTVHVKNPMNGDALTSPHDGGTPVDGTGRGCGCHVAGRSHASSPAMLFLVLTLAVLVARRRYARTRPSGHHGRT